MSWDLSIPHKIAKVVILIPPAVDPGEAPINIIRHIIIKDILVREFISTWENPAVLEAIAINKDSNILILSSGSIREFSISRIKIATELATIIIPVNTKIILDKKKMS